MIFLPTSTTFKIKIKINLIYSLAKVSVEQLKI